MELKQYAIVLVNLDPALGSEIKKTRPCLVISPDEINHHQRTIVIAPMTIRSKPYPTRIKVRHNNQIGWIIIDQIRTIDKSCVVRVLGQITAKEIKSCKAVLKETFVD